MIYSSSQIRIVFKTLREKQMKNRSYQCFIYKYYLERIERRSHFLTISLRLIHISKENVIFVLLSWVSIYLWLIHKETGLILSSLAVLCVLALEYLYLARRDSRIREDERDAT